MNTKVNYTLVGLFVVLLFGALIGMFVWLSSIHDRKVYVHYITYMNESVSGLNVQSPIKYNGVPVGSVEAFALNPNNPKQVKITLKIEAGTPITTATIASLESDGITGVKYIGLTVTKPKAPLLSPTRNLPYPVIQSKLSLFEQLGTTLHNITLNMHALSAGMHQLLNNQNQHAVAQSLESIAQFTKMLADNTNSFQTSIKNSQHILDQTAKATERLPNVMSQLNKTLISIQHASNQLTHASYAATHLMKNGDITLTNFSDQAMPQGIQTMGQLDALTKQLTALTAEIKRNPGIILRGKTPATPGPGEVE